MKLVGSGCPFSDSAASCRPAIHPSVRRSRVAMSSVERLRPIASLRNPAASLGVKRKSATRSSDNWPRPRRRARGNCGSSRVTITSRILWRQVLEQKGEGGVNGFGIDNMEVVDDKDEIIRGGGDFIEQGYEK